VTGYCGFYALVASYIHYSCTYGKERELVKKYIMKRIIMSVITLLVILFILFLMLEMMPGSPFNDEKLTESQKAILNAKYGLDQPIVIRFFNYIKSMLSGDFGVSYTISKNTPIAALLQTRLPISLRIGGQAILIGTIIGLILGIVAAIKHNTIYDTITTVISVLGVSLPSYVFAMTLIYTMGFRLKWFPLLYQVDKPLYSTVLPTVSLCMFTVATVARFTRTEMLEVLGSDYMLLAESKGINSFRLIFKHALRNALIPIITVLAPLVVGLMTGSLVIEKLFSIPGIGSLLVSAIQSNDYNVVIALTFIYCVMYIGIMLVVDILYGVIDPRIRLAKGDEHE
jgi:oligopeptide transport system permease protein